MSSKEKKSCQNIPKYLILSNVLMKSNNLKSVETFPQIVSQAEKEQKSICFVYCLCKYLSNVMKLFSNLHM